LWHVPGTSHIVIGFHVAELVAVHHFAAGTQAIPGRQYFVSGAKMIAHSILIKGDCTAQQEVKQIGHIDEGIIITFHEEGGCF